MGVGGGDYFCEMDPSCLLNICIVQGLALPAMEDIKVTRAEFLLSRIIQTSQGFKTLENHHFSHHNYFLYSMWLPRWD